MPPSLPVRARELGRCSYQCQIVALGLAPWQLPPSHSGDKASGDASGHRESAELLKRMMALGLSVFEPDPLPAIERFEQRTKDHDSTVSP
ncbi:hypothetical protein [Bradyrhizobium sp. F1.13.3]|uniref:hypothetical protein n=1 Tax=Bradyrhizobium sp. F1.13.3 TaxID=3156351 RepID=UPI0033935BCE